MSIKCIKFHCSTCGSDLRHNTTNKPIRRPYFRNGLYVKFFCIQRSYHSSLRVPFFFFLQQKYFFFLSPLPQGAIANIPYGQKGPRGCLIKHLQFFFRYSPNFHILPRTCRCIGIKDFEFCSFLFLCCSHSVYVK